MALIIGRIIHLLIFYHIIIGTDMGAGHSKLSNRYQYLSACFWSFYADYPHIVVAVKSKEDQVHMIWCMICY